MADYTELSERLKVLAEPKSVPCPYQRMVDAVAAEGDPETAELLLGMCEDPNSISIQKLHAELRAAGIIIGRGSISQHRGGSCSCLREIEG